MAFPNDRPKPAHLRGVKETRDKLMKADQVMGLSLKEIADKYRISEREARKGLSDAHKAGALEAMEAGVFTDIMPKALAVLEKHLDEGKSLKAVELAMALFGAVKTKMAPARGSVEINIPDNRAVGIVALDEIRAEKTINAQKRERHDWGAEVHYPSGEDPLRDLPSQRREQQSPEDDPTG